VDLARAISRRWKNCVPSPDWSPTTWNGADTAFWRRLRLSASVREAIPYRIVARRPGDVASCYADPSLAKRNRMAAGKGLMEMCADTCIGIIQSQGTGNDR